MTPQQDGNSLDENVGSSDGQSIHNRIIAVFVQALREANKNPPKGIPS